MRITPIKKNYVYAIPFKNDVFKSQRISFIRGKNLDKIEFQQEQLHTSKFCEIVAPKRLKKPGHILYRFSEDNQSEKKDRHTIVNWIYPYIRPIDIRGAKEKEDIEDLENTLKYIKSVMRLDQYEKDQDKMNLSRQLEKVLSYINENVKR